MPVINQIHPLFVTFKNPAQEKEFLKWNYHEQFIFFKKMVFIGVFAVMMFTIPDLLKSGINKVFIFSFAARIIFCITALSFVLIIQTRKDPVVFHWFLFVLANFITIITVLIMFMMKNFSLTSALSEIMVIMAMYFLIRQRFLYSLLSAIPASIIIILPHLFYSELDSSSLQALLYVFIFINITGIVYNRNINYSCRIEYMGRMIEQKINTRLEQEIVQRIHAEKELLALAKKDNLTGLRSRQSFVDLAEQKILKCQRYGQTISLLILDIDFFKTINEKFSLLEGDLVIIHAAKKIKSRMRKSDLLTRSGNEEFTIIVSNLKINEVLVLAEDLRTLIDKSEFGSQKDIKITVSIGVAQYRFGDTLTDLMRKSNKALHLAKINGHNQVMTYDETKMLFPLN
ncbi:MAG: GGDEF domain-containing protein [Spirochaetia bacterium]|nr:GGDEF domain-containing protein [Spirochaetia bacterium]